MLEQRRRDQELAWMHAVAGPGNLVTFNIPVLATPVGVEDEPANGANGHLEARLRITPNPVGVSSGARVRFELQSARATAMTIQVYDVRGRRVRSWLHGESGQGHQVIEWDGRDDHGLSVAPGVYFVRWAGGGESSTEKMTILR